MSSDLFCFWSKVTPTLMRRSLTPSGPTLVTARRVSPPAPFYTLAPFTVASIFRLPASRRLGVRPSSPAVSRWALPWGIRLHGDERPATMFPSDIAGNETAARWSALCQIQ